jgi:hypothetical protein
MRYMAHLIGIPMLLLMTALATLTVSSRLVVKQELLDVSLYLYCISALLGVAAIGVQIYNCRRLWQASRGVGATCMSCGMPATKRSGVHGPHLHCWQCGHNHSVNSF